MSSGVNVHSLCGIVPEKLSGSSRIYGLTKGLAIGAFLTAMACSAFGQALDSFGPAQSFSVGSDPMSVATADFNRDGITDLAVTNLTSNTVSVLLGDGSGGFGTATDFNVGTSPKAVAVADFNGDGKIDLVVANLAKDSVSVLLGNGSGSFGAATSFPVGTWPQSVAVGDFDGDGKSDIATADYFSGAVSILLGNGSGGFSAATDYSVGGMPISVAVGDFNGDGKSDLAVAKSHTNNVSVLLGNGSGGFSTAADCGVGDWPYSVAAGDFNGDGKSDLVTANYFSASVTVLPGDGSGSFDAGTSFTVGMNPCSVAVGDINDDGKADLITANWGSANVSVLVGNGSGEFGAATNCPVGTCPGSATVGDFNGDGKTDLATANWGSDSVSVLLNKTIHRSATFPGKTDYPLPGSPFSVTKADFNGDGQVDLAAAVAAANSVVVLLGTGQGTFGMPTSFPVGSNPRSVAVGDFNRDGKADLAVANFESNNVSVLLGTGLGSFSAATNYAAGEAFFVVTGDFNGDGKSDLAVADVSGKVQVLLGDGSGGFGTAIPTVLGSSVRTVAVNDFNRDGKSDLAVAMPGKGVSVLLGTGSGGFTFSSNVTFAGMPMCAVTGDFNGDGMADLAASCWTTNDIEVVLGDGAGKFGAVRTFRAGDLPRYAAVSDFNGDGKLDLVVENQTSGIVSVFLGDGHGGFSRLDYPTETGALSVGAGDFNGDGKNDLVVGTSHSELSVLLNRGGQFALETARTTLDTISDGDTASLLRITVSHRGIVGDTPVELAALHLGFSDGNGTTMTSAQLNAIVHTVSIWYDANASGAFEPTEDTCLSSFTNVSLDADGRACLPLPDDAPECLVAYGSPRNYFVVVGITVDAHAQSPNALHITHVTSSSSRGEDPTNDSPLTLEWASDVVSGVVSIIDRLPPTCTVAGPSSPTNAATINFTINFSESVTGLSAGAITVSNGTVSALAGSGSGPYTASVTPAGQGLVTCQVPAGAAQDDGGNFNTASNQASVTYDSVAPTCTVTGPASPTNVGELFFTISFSKPVTGFTSGGIFVVNGLIDELTGSGAGPYTLAVTPGTDYGDGDMTCQITAGAAHDSAGNGNLVSNSVTVVYDTRPPSKPVVVGPAPGSDSGISSSDRITNIIVPVIVGTGEPDTTVTLYADGVAAGTGTVDGAGDWNIAMGALTEGVHTLTAILRDAAGNVSFSSGPVSITIDTVSPTVAIGSVSPSPRYTAPGSVVITFSTPVYGFDLADLSCTCDGLPVSLAGATLNGSGANWSVDNLTSILSRDGTWELSVNVSDITDAAGNLLADSAKVTWLMDTRTDLALCKSVYPRTAHTNELVTYTLEITNAGPTDAENVVLTDPLPANVELVSESLPASSVDGTTRTWNVATLPAGEATTITLQARVLEPVVITNTASVVYDKDDLSAGNNISSATVAVGPGADLAVSVAANPVPPVLGQPLRFVISVTNQGPDVAENGLVSDIIPPNTVLTTASVSQGSVDTSGANVIGDLGTIAREATATMTVTVIPQQTVDIVNIAGVSSSVFDRNTTDNTVTTTLSVIQASGPDLIADSLTASFSKRGPAKLNIRMRVLNRGDVAAGRNSVSYYLSDKNYLDSSAKLIGYVTVNALKPGRSQLLAAPVRIVRPAGPVYLITVIDPADKVAEGNELNNVRVFGPLQ